MPVFSSILCPVDFSTNSRAALRLAAAIANRSGGHLFVLYVDDPLIAIAATTRRNARAVISKSHADLRRFVSSSLGAAASEPGATLLTIAGKPSEEIVKVAERHDCDLIVMGYRGAGRASRMFFGSTTEGVVRTTSVPVLAIPPARRRRNARLPLGPGRAGLKRAS